MDKIGIDDLFDRRLTYPDLPARKRFARLVRHRRSKIAFD